MRKKDNYTFDETCRILGVYRSQLRALVARKLVTGRVFVNGDMRFSCAELQVVMSRAGINSKRLELVK